MKDAYTKHDELRGQVRVCSTGKYKILSFSTTVFVNNHTTWLIEYLETGKQFYKPESQILENKVVKR